MRVLAALAGAAAIAGCTDSGQKPAADAAVQVGVYTIKEQSLTLTTTLPGRTSAYREAEVRPQVDGIVQKRLFKEGAQVKKGEQLYQIDDAIYRAEYNRAKANLAAAQKLAQRYERLLKTSAISQQQYDDAISSWKQAQAQAELARINLVYTRVLSPISGKVGRSAVSEGALVTSGQAQQMATVQQIDPIYVDVTQPITEVLRLRREMQAGRLAKAGQDQARVTLRLADGSVYPQSGVLQFSEITVDQGTGSVTLRAEFPNPDGSLLPGMFVQARLDEGVRNGAILAPQQAVLRDQMGQAYAWVVGADDKVERRAIRTERTVGNQWLVDGGLSSGERVVAEGTQRVRGGIKVAAAPAARVAPVNDFDAGARQGQSAPQPASNN